MSSASRRIRAALGCLCSAALLAGLPACAPQDPGLPALRLLDVRPRERSEVYLNEDLVLLFSSELDSSSVTSQSLRITTPDGISARGTPLVSGRELRFVPEPVRSPDLRDGGYLPSTLYRVELSGCPRADALRATNGACLARPLRFEFRTIAADQKVVFDDSSPDKGRPLRVLPSAGAGPGRVRMTAQGGLLLEGDEPIDPTTLGFRDFALVPEAGGSLRNAYPLRAVLVENHNRHSVSRLGTTLVRLLPEVLVPPGMYRLYVDPAGPRFEDFSHNRIPPPDLRNLRIEVGVEAPRIANEYLEEFLPLGVPMRSSALVPGSDGTAAWSGNGRLEVRYPAAAGDGSLGEVRLEPRVSAADIHASRLYVLEEITSLLEVGGGLCVLRSQGAIEIAGSVRRVAPVHLGPLPEMRTGETLSEWLARHAGTEVPLTVLVAGGDIRISGELEVPGPLLLVAGGRVRMSGRIGVAGAPTIGGSSLLQIEEGKGIAVWSTGNPKGGLDTTIEEASLVLDPPRLNPLVKPLIYAVRSNPVPPMGGAARWLPSEGVRGRAGAGAIRVRYAGERRSPNAAGDIEVLVDDPALLVDCPTLRLVLELEVPPAPGEPWDPPMLDSVRVRWESDGPKER